ncbi:MAG: TatD family hydrolase [Candidatus Aenigmarchaeota archaeon]|nr:TatD family hydrolase [Candidatus Aenigmarchaeota archaeon]
MHGMDSHCHLEKMPDGTAEEAKKHINGIVTICADIEDAKKTLGLIDGKFVFGALGLHPESADKYPPKALDDYIQFIFSSRKKLSAIGEVGVDYIWHKKKEEQENDEEIFRQFIELSKELKLPLVVHSRGDNAVHDVIRILTGEDCRGSILHFFSGTEQELKDALELGYWIAYNTVICKSKKYEMLIQKTPIGSVLLETDAPWCSPFPDEKGQENVPWNIHESAKKIGGILGMPKEDVLKKTEENARKAYRI